MRAIYKQKLKGEMQDYLVAQGFTVSVTSTPALVFFTDKRINVKSTPNITNGKQYGYITSFGIKTAQKILGQI